MALKTYTVEPVWKTNIPVLREACFLSPALSFKVCSTVHVLFLEFIIKFLRKSYRSWIFLTLNICKPYTKDPIFFIFIHFTLLGEKDNVYINFSWWQCWRDLNLHHPHLRPITMLRMPTEKALCTCMPTEFKVPNSISKMKVFIEEETLL